MGVYRSVYCEMTCEHCGRRHRAEIQFETGDDRQEQYEDGQRIPQDDGLAPGVSYDAVVNLFCADCDQDWHAAHQAAICETLAGFVEQGRLTLRSKDAAADHTAEGLRRLGRTTRDAVLRDPNGRHPIAALAFYKLTWDGGAVDFMDPANDPSAAFKKCFHGAVDDALKAAGWPLGRDSLCEDLRVAIGEDRVIFVLAADGMPIR